MLKLDVRLWVSTIICPGSKDVRYSSSSFIRLAEEINGTFAKLERDAMVRLCAMNVIEIDMAVHCATFRNRTMSLSKADFGSESGVRFYISRSA